MDLSSLRFHSCVSLCFFFCWPWELQLAFADCISRTLWVSLHSHSNLCLTCSLFVTERVLYPVDAAFAPIWPCVLYSRFFWNPWTIRPLPFSMNCSMPCLVHWCTCFTSQGSFCPEISPDWVSYCLRKQDFYGASSRPRSQSEDLIPRVLSNWLNLMARSHHSRMVRATSYEWWGPFQLCFYLTFCFFCHHGQTIAS